MFPSARGKVPAYRCGGVGFSVEVAPLAALLGLPGNAEGVIRDMKFTFRGSPDQALDGEASLRLAADGFRWNERGWESLALGGA